MNPKIFVGAVVGVFAIVLGVIGFSGQSIISDISNDGFFQSPGQEAAQVLPVQIELASITVEEVTERAAILEIEFLVTNPNFKSALLQFIKYTLYEDGERIHIGEIGERADTFIIGSNYFTILSDQSTILSDKIIIKNSGNTPELWDALTNDSLVWRVTGAAHFNLSSMTSGGENIVEFEFSPGP